jgi:hypothetical protein
VCLISSATVGPTFSEEIIPAWSLSADLKSFKVVPAGSLILNLHIIFAQLSGQLLKIHLQ